MSERRPDMRPAEPSRRYLQDGWEVCSTPPDACPDPTSLEVFAPSWQPARAPSSAAGVLRAAGLWSLDGPTRRFDSEDWWYRLRHDLDAGISLDGLRLGLDGLATLCDVWVNGTHVLHSENMHLAHELESPPFRGGSNEIMLVFRALDPWLKRRRPRPRWRTPMVENQQLRWARTSLLGRTPGWSPPAAVVGPWRPVWLESIADTRVNTQLLRASVAGKSGVLHFEARLRGHLPTSVEILLESSGGTAHRASVQMEGDALHVRLHIPDVALWWPHTHGTPALHVVSLALHFADGSTRVHGLGAVGFREILASTEDGDFGLQVNGELVFCRGACWTPLDVVTLDCTADDLRAALVQVRDAGMNMLRISGSFAYEREEFFALCDELGILVWQDFMFANMDYPADDAAFMESVRVEAEQQLTLWDRHPCIAVICGNSEVSQQSAMWGAPRELWNPALFGTVLAALAGQRCPNAVYWPSSAWGGSFPHQVDCGTTSYYGVGAYLRGADDLRRSGLRFATECLGFANIPADGLLATLSSSPPVRVHHAIWKQRAPRDLGAGWDFDDVRDHYLAKCYGMDPVQLRYSDHARYLELGRRVTGEMMRSAFIEWRRRGSACRGALIWFLRDLWPGAGWGIVDAVGSAKAPLHMLRDVLQPRWIGITDEGLNGPSLHVGNELASALEGHLSLELYRRGRHLLLRSERKLRVEARATLALPVADLLDEFHDITHAYRFGPPGCDVVVATLQVSDGGQLQDVFLPDPRRFLDPDESCVLTARAKAQADGRYLLAITAPCFARSVQVDAEHYDCDTQYFPLLPSISRLVMLRPSRPGLRPPAGFVYCLNAANPCRIEIVA